MAWSFNNVEPVSIQIARRLRQDILRGRFQTNEQIPPVRQLAFEASVNPNTMQKALVKLEEEGLLHTRGTVGRFVTSDRDALARARETLRRESVVGWIREAEALGMSREEMIRYINKEGNS